MPSFQTVNAWIFLNEDEPKGTGYTDPSNCFQTLITNNVYQSVDILFLAFTEIVPTTAPGAIHVVDGFTLQNGAVTHQNGWSNADYMEKVVVDAKENNPNIRFLTTLDFGKSDQFSQIFAGCTNAAERAAAATAFAKNAVAFFQAFGLNGFDIDWEGEIAYGTTQDQFDALMTGLKGQFGNDYLLTLSPATTALLTGDVVNATVDFLNLQIYGGVSKSEFLDLGIDKSRLAYGATFEDFAGRQQTPKEAYQGAMAGNFAIITQWRLNSGNFQQEQDGQVTLYSLCKG